MWQAGAGQDSARGGLPTFSRKEVIRRPAARSGTIRGISAAVSLERYPYQAFPKRNLPRFDDEKL